MTEAEYVAAVYAAERYVERHGGFSCPVDCAIEGGAWQHHAEAAITYLTDVIDAAMYELERPRSPDTGIPHLDENILRIERDMNRRNMHRRRR